MTMKFYFFLVLFGIQSCVSEGTYFQLDDLRRMVRERHPAQDLVHRYGTPKVQYSDDIFTAEIERREAKSAELFEQTVDEGVFHGIDGEHPDNFGYDDDNPYAKASFLKREGKPTRGVGANETSLRPHMSDTYVVVDCEGQPKTLKYHAKRNDPNGYVETQYTVFFLDQNWRICGFKSRSHFAAR